MDASKTKVNNSGVHISPKPICLHLNSPGGYLISTDIFYTLIQSQRVPLCVITETLTASAATFIQLLAPYRLIIDYSRYLIHDSRGWNFSKTANTVKSDYQTINSKVYAIKFFKKRTKLSDKEINEFIERDIFVDSKYCLDKGIVDRILHLPKINNPNYYSNYSNLQLNLSSFLKKTNLNHIYISYQIFDNSSKVVNGSSVSSSLLDAKSLNELSILLDNLFLIKKDNVKPIIIHFKPDSNIAMWANANPLQLAQLNYRLALIQKRVPIIAFIEGQQYFDTLSTILMCPIRIMMKPSLFQSTFSSVNSGSEGWGFKTIDVIDNSLFIYNNIVKLYREISNLPEKFYKQMRHRIINLTKDDLLKYNIIHLCLNIHHENVLPSDIIKYLQINKLTGLNNDNNVKKSKDIVIKKKKSKKVKK
jgi:ATP-dependent protease ClpP protease subunit